jgi:hypothetical protein
VMRLSCPCSIAIASTLRAKRFAAIHESKL